MTFVTFLLCVCADELRGVHRHRIRRLCHPVRTTLGSDSRPNGLRDHVRVVLRGRGHCRSDRGGSVRTSEGRMTRGRHPFVSVIVRIVRGGCSGSRFNIRRLTSRVQVGHDILDGVLGTRTNRPATRFVHGCHLSVTGGVVARGITGQGVARVTCHINFGSPGCFAHYFAGRCNISPSSCGSSLSR